MSKFVGEIWRYQPIIIIPLVAGLVVFVLSVIDTHCCRKKIQKKRQRPKDHKDFKDH